MKNLIADLLVNYIERDLPFCGGNCSSTVPSILEAAKPAFTNTSHFEAFAVPGTGHGLNLVSKI